MHELVYLDLCCLKRPFDDQRSTRIQLGTLAEAAGARWLVTTDDRLVALGERHRAVLGVEITSPMRLLENLPGGEP